MKKLKVYQLQLHHVLVNIMVIHIIEMNVQYIIKIFLKTNKFIRRPISYQNYPIYVCVCLITLYISVNCKILKKLTQNILSKLSNLCVCLSYNTVYKCKLYNFDKINTEHFIKIIQFMCVSVL